MVVNEFLILLGLTGTALGVIGKFICLPIKKLNEALETITYVDCAVKVLMECELAHLNNIITGNSVDKLKEKRDKLEEFCIKN